MQHERNLGRYLSEAGADPFNGVLWWGSEEYILRSLLDAYVSARIPDDKRAADLNDAGRVLRLRFRMPTMPEPDCKACLLSGDEELRYWSLSFADSDNTTVATLSDLDVITGGQGYATVIVTFGTPLPSWVNAGVNYTVLDLSRPAGEEINLKHMTLRNILPSQDFVCSTNNVPPRAHEYHSEGGYMGEFLPVVDYPIATELPKWAKPLTGHGGTCINPAPPPEPCS
jgi:hypothetical protein